MKTIEVKLYEHEDLIKPENKAILDKVIKKWNSTLDLELETQDIRDCIDSFCKEFKLRTHSSYVDFRNDDDGAEELEGNRLRTYLINNRPFFVPKLYWTKRTAKHRASKITKVFNNLDSTPFAQTLVETYWSMLRVPDLTMYEILVTLDRAAREEFEYIQILTSSQDYILEAIEANDYNFNEQGEMING